MGTSEVIAGLSIITTVALGALSIHLMLKRKYPGRITLIKEECIPLFDSIVKNLPELAVLYKNAPVHPNLVLLKGFVLNTGTKDIAPTMVEDGVSIALPEGYKWLTAKVVSSSPGVQGEIELQETDLLFDMGLLRCNEHVRFEALAEVPMGHESGQRATRPDMGRQLEGAINVTHRIAETQKPESKDLPSRPRRTLRLLKMVAPLFVAYLLAGLGVVTIQFVAGWPTKVHYVLDVGAGREVEVKTPTLRDGMLKLKGVTQSYSEEVPLQEFLSRGGWTPVILPDKLQLFLTLIACAVVVALLGVLALLAYLDDRQARRLRTLLGFDA